MFKAKLKDAKKVKGIFEAVSAIIDNTRLKVDPDIGLSMTAMDGSHICLVSLNLKKEDLDEFEADQKYELGMNLDDFVKVIKRSGAGDQITLSHDPKEKKLIIELKPENGKKTRTFTVSLIDIDADEINMDSLNAMVFDNTCSFDLDYLDEAIKDAEIFSEVLVIKAQEKLIFSTEGSIGDMKYELEKDELKDAKLEAESEGNFAIQFLKSILKVSAVSKEVKMALKSEAPAKMEFKILENSSILYFLAPRVEEDTETGAEE
jgi:proliferating cell nuclear antigen